MKKILEGRIGKEVDIQAIGGAFSGKLVRIEDNVAILEKDERTVYVSIEHIIAVMDKPEKKVKSPGFLPKS